MVKSILHCDVDNFFASVEQVLNPSLADKPVIVCGSPQKRHGIVLAKSKLAKECGVQTAEVLSTALSKCPDAILVPPSYKEYSNYAIKLYNLCSNYSNLVESFGQDECWIDISHLVNNEKTSYSIAEEISNKIKNTLGFTVSIGISFNKVFAKLASDYQKPDKITEININNYEHMVFHLPIEKLLNVGQKTKKALNKYNIFTIGDLANTSSVLIKNLFGKNGELLHAFANGTEEGLVAQHYYNSIPKSIGNGLTLPQDIISYNDAMLVILHLSQYISFRLKSKNIHAKGLCLSLRFSDLSFKLVQRSLDFYFDSTDIIFSTCSELLFRIDELKKEKFNIRAISIRTFDLAKSSIVQLSLLSSQSNSENELDNQIFNIRKKYGFNKIKLGFLETDSLSNFFAKNSNGFNSFKLFDLDDSDDVEYINN